MKQGRKFWLAIIYEAALIVVLAGIILLDKFDATVFGVWMAAFAAGYVTYVMGNVADKAPPA